MVDSTTRDNKIKLNRRYKQIEFENETRRSRQLKKKKISQTNSDKIFNIIQITILTIVCLSVLYPLYYVIIASFSHPDGVYQGKVWLLPYKPTLLGYQKIFENEDIWMGYRNSLLYLLSGTFVSLFVSLTAAYALAWKRLVGSKYLNLFFIFTMYFNGGIIPTYLLIQSLGMLNSPLAIILPGAVSAVNLIIIRTFFTKSIPFEMYESAAMDGCSHFRYFFQILLPLAKAIIAVMALYYGIGLWNSYYQALIYLHDKKLYPLSLILREILISTEGARREMSLEMEKQVMEKQKLAELIKYGVIIVSSLPMLIMYPFVQKHFVKGVMIGSVKG